LELYPRWHCQRRGGPAPAAAIPQTPAGAQLAWALEQINSGAADLSAGEIERRFAPGFLAALPPADLLGLFRAYFAPHGPMAVARFEGAVYDTFLKGVLITPGGDWRVTLGVEPAGGRIDRLFFEPLTLPQPLPKAITSWKPIARRLAKIAPLVSFFAGELRHGELRPLYEYEPERTLSIASAFKLYVLGELARQVDAGEIAWHDPLVIDDGLKSLPNGLMLLEPAGAAFPIYHFAEQMIGASDNTATDHLIARLGRERIEGAFPAFGHAHAERNVPLLMTREWFAMRMRLSPAEIEAYLASDTEEKRAFIAGRVNAEAATLTQFELWPGGYFIDRVEWFASAADLGRMMAGLHQLAERPGLAPVFDALSTNPGIPFDARTWAYVGFKEGYETGVKSLAWLLQRGDGRWFVLAAIINDLQKEINGYGLSQLVMPAVWLLANRE
jgi:hypothetical protein